METNFISASITDTTNHIVGSNQTYMIENGKLYNEKGQLADLTEAEIKIIADYKTFCEGICAKYPLSHTLKKVIYKDHDLSVFTLVTMNDVITMKKESEIPEGEVQGVPHSQIIQMFKAMCTAIKEGYNDSYWIRTDDYGQLAVDEITIDVVSASDDIKTVIYLTGEMLKKCL